MDKDTKQMIVQTMIQQMGGQRALGAMIGAKNFAYGTTEEGNVYLTFKHMKGNNGINHNRITLMGDDTYTVEYIKVHGNSVTTVEKREMVFFCDLRPFFREVTGLEIIMPRVVGING